MSSAVATPAAITSARPYRARLGRWVLNGIAGLALGFILFVLSFIVLAISRLLLRPRAKGASA